MRTRLLLAIALAAPAVFAADEERTYEVTVTNLTRGQRFTPILAVTHMESASLFRLGEMASPQLRTLAEEGNVGPLSDALKALTNDVKEVTNTPAPPPLDRLLSPGRSAMITIRGSRFFDRLSIAAMLIPTNDALVALNSVKLPEAIGETAVHMALAYDAGTERNDETCGAIPGPGFVECQRITPSGDGGGAQVGGGEGFVHVHAGIHGIADFNAAMRDWRNPVARVVIRRTR
jgi:hypothetical protein